MSAPPTDEFYVDFDSEMMLRLDEDVHLWMQFSECLRDTAAEWFWDRHPDAESTPGCDDPRCSCRLAAAFYFDYQWCTHESINLVGSLHSARLRAASLALRCLLGCWIPFTPKSRALES